MKIDAKSSNDICMAKLWRRKIKKKSGLSNRYLGAASCPRLAFLSGALVRFFLCFYVFAIDYASTQSETCNLPILRKMVHGQQYISEVFFSALSFISFVSFVFLACFDLIMEG